MHQLPSIHSTFCPDGVKQSTCRTDNFVKKNYTLDIRSVSTAPIAPSIFCRLCSNRPSAAVSIAANPYSVFAYPESMAQPASDPGTQRVGHLLRSAMM